MKKSTIIFSLTGNQNLTNEICENLGLERSECKVTHFADGEILVVPQVSVRGKHVYIVQGTSNPVTERLMEILICIDACKRASAREITVVMPYFGYARQDRKAKARQPITAKLVAELLQVAGANRVVTMDLHAAQIQGFFDIPIDDLAALPLIAQYFKAKDLDNVTVVSPDHGGANRARLLAEILQAPIAIIDKRRPEPNKAQVMNIIGEVKGRNCIIIDDMVDTAGTLVAGVEALKEFGANDVYTAATHGILSNPAVERIQNSQIKEMVVTNTIELSDEKKIDKIKVISVAPLLARTIEAIEMAKPVSKVVESFQ